MKVSREAKGRRPREFRQRVGPFSRGPQHGVSEAVEKFPFFSKCLLTRLMLFQILSGILWIDRLRLSEVRRSASGAGQHR